MGKRRKYSWEYKREAVALANDPGVTKSQTARELGINASLLGRWNRELKEGGRPAFGGQGKPRDEEMARLKRELVWVHPDSPFKTCVFRLENPVPDPCPWRSPDSTSTWARTSTEPH